MWKSVGNIGNAVGIISVLGHKCGPCFISPLIMSSMPWQSRKVRSWKLTDLRLAVIDVFLLSGMAGAIYYLSEVANPDASCFPAFELWPTNWRDWGRWRGTETNCCGSYLEASLKCWTRIYLWESFQPWSRGSEQNSTENEDQAGTEHSGCDWLFVGVNMVWFMELKTYTRRLSKDYFRTKLRVECCWSSENTSSRWTEEDDVDGYFPSGYGHCGADHRDTVKSSESISSKVPCHPPVCWGDDMDPMSPPQLLQFLASWQGHRRTHCTPSAFHIVVLRPRKRVCVCGCVCVWSELKLFWYFYASACSLYLVLGASCPVNVVLFHSVSFYKAFERW